MKYVATIEIDSEEMPNDGIPFRMRYRTLEGMMSGIRDFGEITKIEAVTPSVPAVEEQRRAVYGR